MKATMVLGGDWEGLYIDGVLKAEGHSVSAYQIFTALDIPYETVDASLPGQNFDILENLGRCPESLGEFEGVE